MRLEKIIEMVEHTETRGSVSREIAGITCDSRHVKPGWLFAALPGVHVDGRSFVRDAIAKGAVAIVSEANDIKTNGSCHILVPDARAALAEIADAFYGSPSLRMQTIGVTGTNGKTTISFLCRDMLKADNRIPGMIGTVRYEIGDREIPASRTTPESVELQAMLSEMAEVGCKSAVMEVSSHSLAQMRVWRVEFDAAMFTNLTHEHLDYHVTMEEYFDTKCRLFRWLGRRGKKAIAIVNADDPWGQDLLKSGDISVPVLTFGMETAADVRAADVRLNTRGSRFTLHTPWGDVPNFKFGLPGRFNISNLLASIAACGSVGVPLPVMTEVAMNFRSVPGRLEEVPTDRGFQVFVDYAHTEDALRNVLVTLRETGPNRIILVFGCGGNRDTLKRPSMGAAAACLADRSIITSDNPRKEDPADIIEQIRAGFGAHDNYEVIQDRAEAIRRALDLAEKGDIVLIAGKGHETFQEFSNTSVPFDDRLVVTEFLQADNAGIQRK